VLCRKAKERCHEDTKITKKNNSKHAFAFLRDLRAFVAALLIFAFPQLSAIFYLPDTP